MSDEHNEMVMRFRGEKGEKGDRGEGMTQGARRAIVFLFVLSVLLAGGSGAFTLRQVNESQQKWCTTLDLLTSQPVPKPANPKANPSRESAYVFYTDIHDLRRHFGCG